MCFDASDSAFGNAFLVAVLLTGTANRAEQVILDVIAAFTKTVDPNRQLLERSIEAALALNRSIPNASLQDDQSAGCALPKELKRVLDLPLDVRESFVLRILLKLSREHVANLLCLDEEELDEKICSGAFELAQLQDHMVADTVPSR